MLTRAALIGAVDRLLTRAALITRAALMGAPTSAPASAHLRRRLPFEIGPFVLLPDHLHCVWTLPSNDDDFAKRWRQIKGWFTHAYLSDGGRDWDVTEQHGRQGRLGVWQPRYWEHRIRDERDYERYRDYIHLNPVKHGYVDRPEEWPWTSFHHHVRLGWLDPHWPGSTPLDLPAIDD